MRKTHLNASWGLLFSFLLCFVLAAPRAYSAQADGIQVMLTRVPFSEAVTELAKLSGKKLVMDTAVDATVDMTFPEPTSLEDILTHITALVGLKFWKDGSTYVIGKPSNAPAAQVSPVVDPAPRIVPPPAASVTETALQAAAPAKYAQPAPTYQAVTPERKPVVRKIELQNTAAQDICSALGIKGYRPTSKQAEERMGFRIQTMLDPRHPRVSYADEGDGYSSPAMNVPWNGSGVARRNSITDSNQFQPQPPYGGGGYRPGGVVSGSPFGNPGGYNAGSPFGAPATNPGGAVYDPNTVTDTNNANDNNTNDGGGLEPFIPKGIKSVVGLVGLNSLLVMAETDDDIDQLEMLIRLLDQPVKQVIIEVMFVQMSVVDAMSIGNSWELIASPFAIQSNNGGASGNFGIQYLGGNFRANLSSLLTNSRAKVVNAPRVVVQNGGGASIMLSTYHPFVTVDTQEDVFGRKIETPQVQVQQFSQGLVVNQVIIHPDDSVTALVVPQLIAPGPGVGIPGGSGQVSGGQGMAINTLLRVKNGQTMLMGAFVNKQEEEGGSRAPLLSDIPIVGPLLFKNVTKQKDNTETLIFITPTVMKEDTTDFGGMAALTPLF